VKKYLKNACTFFTILRNKKKIKQFFKKSKFFPLKKVEKDLFCISTFEFQAEL